MTADDAFTAGCEDGAEMGPPEEETTRAIARTVGSDLKEQRTDEKDDSGDTAA